MRLFHKLINVLSEEGSSLFSKGLSGSAQQTRRAAEYSGTSPAACFDDDD